MAGNADGRNLCGTLGNGNSFALTGNTSSQALLAVPSSTSPVKGGVSPDFNATS